MQKSVQWAHLWALGFRGAVTGWIAGPSGSGAECIGTGWFSRRPGFWYHVLKSQSLREWEFPLYLFLI